MQLGSVSPVFWENEELFVHVQEYEMARVPSRVSGGGGPDPRLSGHFVAKRYKIPGFWQIGNMQTTDDTGWAGVDGQTHT